MTTFLRLEIYSGRDNPPAFVMVNTDHIVRIHPTWPSGCNIISSEVDDVSLHVTASFDELQQRLCSTGGRTQVYTVDTPARFAEACEDCDRGACHGHMCDGPDGCVCGLACPYERPGEKCVCEPECACRNAQLLGADLLP